MGGQTDRKMYKVITMGLHRLWCGSNNFPKKNRALDKREYLMILRDNFC